MFPPSESEAKRSNEASDVKNLGGKGLKWKKAALKLKYGRIISEGQNVWNDGKEWNIR